MQKEPAGPQRTTERAAVLALLLLLLLPYPYDAGGDLRSFQTIARS